MPLVRHVTERSTQGPVDPVSVGEHLATDLRWVFFPVDLERHEHRDSLAALSDSDDDPLASGDSFQQRGQVRLRFRNCQPFPCF